MTLPLARMPHRTNEISEFPGSDVSGILRRSMPDVPRQIRVVMLEDDASYIAVMRRVLKEVDDVHWCGSHVNPVRFLAELPKMSADVFLLDIHMPKISGLECVREIKQCLPGSRVIMVSVHDDDDYVLKAFLEGADGYLLKDATPDQIAEAIQEAQHGGAPMSPSIARKVIGILGRSQPRGDNPKPTVAPKPVKESLTMREMEILQLLAQGRRYGEIAVHLSVSLQTVKTHIRRLYAKLNVHNRIEAIERSAELGLLPR